MPDDNNDLNQNTNLQPTVDSQQTNTSSQPIPATETPPAEGQEPIIEAPVESTEAFIPKPFVEETSAEAPPSPPTLEDQSLDIPPPPIDTTTTEETKDTDEKTLENTNNTESFPNDIPPVVTPPKPKKKLGGKKLIATVLGFLVLVGGIGAGVILVQNQQDIREKAAVDEGGGGGGGTAQCNSGQTQSQLCNTSADCDGTKTRTCTSTGIWGSWSSCKDKPGDGCPSTGGGTNACVSAGGACVSSPSCSRVNKAIVNGGNGCNAAAGEICCSTTTATTNCSSLTADPWKTCPAECAGTVDELATCTLGAKKWKCSGKQWQPNYGDEGDCSGSCPWPETNGKCWPVAPDACSTLGKIICIEDPFASKCVVWDNSCPSGQQYYYKAFDWSADFSEIEARNECGGIETSPPPGGASAQCLNIKAYDTDWKELKGDALKSVKAGDKIRFAVKGTATSGSFDKAKFVVNNQVTPEVTAKNPSEEYYYEYTIPEGVSSFTIKGQIHHTSIGWSN